MLLHVVRRWLILLLAVLGPCWTIAFAQARNGTLDLQDWDFDKKPIVRLAGDWQFHWGQLYTQDTWHKASEEPALIAVPGLWNFARGYPKRGFATYRLHVVLKEVRPLAIRMPWVLSASRLFIDDLQISSIGQVASSDDPLHYIAKLDDDYWNFTPASREFDIILQVSSYHLHLPGVPNAPTLGIPHAIKRDYQVNVGVSLFLFGCLFVMSIYHLCLYALRTKARSTLYFAVACLFIALYMMSNSGPALNTFFPQFAYAGSMRFYMIWMLSLPFFAYYCHEIFPQFFSLRLGHFLLITGAGIYLGSFLTQFKDVEGPFIAYNGAAGLYFCYTLVQVIRAYQAKEDGAGIFLAGTLIIFATAVHDLFRFLFESMALGGLGMFAFIICQSILLARRFSRAFDHVDRLSADLRIERDQVMTLNQNLEATVTEKTREIRSIMEHIPLGIFLITKEGRQVHKDYSQHLLNIFEEKDLAGSDGYALLFSRSELGTDEKSQVESVMAAVLGEDSLAFELNQATLPRETVVIRKSGGRMVLDLAWSPIVDVNDKVTQLLVTVRDVTELRSLELEARDKQEELHFIQELINVSASTFHRFTQSCEDFLNENRRLINSSSFQKKDMDVLKILFINMHTMKGAARSLYFKKMTRIFHDVEQYYALLQKEPHAIWDIRKMNHDLDDAERIVRIYEGINTEKLGRGPNADKGTGITLAKARQVHDKIRKARQLLHGAKEGDVLGLLESAGAELFAQLYKPLPDVLQEISMSTETLARDLGKMQPKLVVVGEAFCLDTRTEELLHKIFIHIIRNTMDHGIETPEVRAATGKDRRGTISIEVQRIGTIVSLFYTDDGRGLDLEKIRDTAEKNGLTAQGLNPTQSEVANFIFLSGLTTAGTATDISGRGVGMDAIRKFARQAGGDARIQLHGRPAQSGQFHPFTLEIQLPATLFICSELELEAD